MSSRYSLPNKRRTGQHRHSSEVALAARSPPPLKGIPLHPKRCLLLPSPSLMSIHPPPLSHQHYLSWSKRLFRPRLSPESELILGRYYQALRQSDDRSAACTTVRMLESLVRIAQAHARLMARHDVTSDDALVAVMVVEASHNCLMVRSQKSASPRNARVPLKSPSRPPLPWTRPLSVAIQSRL